MPEVLSHLYQLVPELPNVLSGQQALEHFSKVVSKFVDNAHAERSSLQQQYELLASKEREWECVVQEERMRSQRLAEQVRLWEATAQPNAGQVPPPLPPPPQQPAPAVPQQAKTSTILGGSRVRRGIPRLPLFGPADGVQMSPAESLSEPSLNQHFNGGNTMRGNTHHLRMRSRSSSRSSSSSDDSEDSCHPWNHPNRRLAKKRRITLSDGDGGVQGASDSGGEGEDGGGGVEGGGDSGGGSNGGVRDGGGGGGVGGGDGEGGGDGGGEDGGVGGGDSEGGGDSGGEDGDDVAGKGGDDDGGEEMMVEHEGAAHRDGGDGVTHTMNIPSVLLEGDTVLFGIRFLKAVSRPLISAVTAGGLAEKIGLKANDLLVSVNGVSIETKGVSHLSHYPPPITPQSCSSCCQSRIRHPPLQTASERHGRSGSPTPLVIWSYKFVGAWRKN
jgi:hypothetical protein